MSAPDRRLRPDAARAVRAAAPPPHGSPAPVCEGAPDPAGRQSAAPAAPARSFARDASSMLLSRVAVYAVAFLSGILAARALGPAGKGTVAALLVYPSLLVSLAEAGVRQSAVFLVGGEKHPEARVRESVLFLLAGTSVVGVGLCAAAFHVLNPGAFSRAMMAVAVLLVPLRLTISYVSGILLGKQQVDRFIRLRTLPIFVQLLLVCVLVVWLRLGPLGAATALVLSSAPVAVYGLWLLRTLGPLRARPYLPAVKDLLRLGAVYGGALFLLALNYRMDVVLLTRMRPLAELGQYAMAVGLAELVWEIPNALGLLVFSRRAGTREGRRFTTGVLRLARVALVAGALAALLMAWAMPRVIPLLYGEAFRPSVGIIHAILPGIVAFSLFKILNADLDGKGRPAVSVGVMAPALLLNVALNLAWIPRWGARGAALASTVSYALAAAAMVVVYCRIVRVPLRRALRYRRSDFDFLRPLAPRWLRAR